MGVIDGFSPCSGSMSVFVLAFGHAKTKDKHRCLPRSKRCGVDSLSCPSPGRSGDVWCLGETMEAPPADTPQYGGWGCMISLTFSRLAGFSSTLENVPVDMKNRAIQQVWLEHQGSFTWQTMQGYPYFAPKMHLRPFSSPN